MNKKKENSFFGKIPSKIFKVLIIGFIIAIGSLSVNLVLILWCFKNSYFLLIIEIGLISLNAVNIFLSVILRIWRNNDSIFNKNFSSSKIIAIIILVLLTLILYIFKVIINFIASISEDVLFYFVISYLNLYKDIREDSCSNKADDPNHYNNSRDLGLNNPKNELKQDPKKIKIREKFFCIMKKEFDEIKESKKIYEF